MRWLMQCLVLSSLLSVEAGADALPSTVWSMAGTLQITTIAQWLAYP